MKIYHSVSRRLAVILAALAGFTAGGAMAADYTLRTTPAGEVVLTLSGPITPVDGALFLEQVNRAKPRIIELEGPGGDFLSATRIGVIIHERALSTHVIGHCQSACAYIWIAGRTMLADEGAKIAIHLPVSISGPDEGVPNAAGLTLVGWYLGKLNIGVEMMDAFLTAATDDGTVPNRYFDMLQFATYWNAPVKVRPVHVADTTG